MNLVLFQFRLQPAVEAHYLDSSNRLVHQLDVRVRHQPSHGSAVLVHSDSLSGQEVGVGRTSDGHSADNHLVRRRTGRVRRLRRLRPSK